MHRVGHSRTTHVVVDHSSEATESIEEPDRRRFVTYGIEVLERAREIEDVSITLTEHLIGEKPELGLDILRLGPANTSRTWDENVPAECRRKTGGSRTRHRQCLDVRRT